jgi:hypothetical protein
VSETHAVTAKVAVAAATRKEVKRMATPPFDRVIVTKEDVFAGVNQFVAA